MKFHLKQQTILLFFFFFHLTVFLTDLTVRTSLGIYGIASLHFFSYYSFFFVFLTLNVGTVLLKGEKKSEKEKEQSVRSCEQGLGNGEKSFFFVLVIRVFAGWANTVSLQNYFRGSRLRYVFPVLGFLSESLQAPGA